MSPWTATFRACRANFQSKAATLGRFVQKAIQFNAGKEGVESPRSSAGAPPLDPNQLALVRRRVQNADRFLRSSEWGAARYELQRLDELLREAPDECQAG